MRAFLVCIAAFVVLSSGAEAQEKWPSQTVRIVVPFPAGGSTDLTAREVAQGLAAEFGQTFIVENRAGAGSTLGTASVAKAPGDGYTFLITSSHYSIVPSLYENLQYDPLKDLKGVSLLVNLPVILVATPKLPVSNVLVDVRIFGRLAVPAELSEVHGAGIDRYEAHQIEFGELRDMREPALHRRARPAGRQGRIEQQIGMRVEYATERVDIDRAVVMTARSDDRLAGMGVDDRRARLDAGQDGIDDLVRAERDVRIILAVPRAVDGNFDDDRDVAPCVAHVPRCFLG
jgi:hypothetical protein